jgi:hypothetical protein
MKKLLLFIIIILSLSGCYIQETQRTPQRKYISVYKPIERYRIVPQPPFYTYPRNIFRYRYYNYNYNYNRRHF